MTADESRTKRPRSKKGAEESEVKAGKRKKVDTDEESDDGIEGTQRVRNLKRAEWEREEREWRSRLDRRLEQMSSRLAIYNRNQSTLTAAVRMVSTRLDRLTNLVEELMDSDAEMAEEQVAEDNDAEVGAESDIEEFEDGDRMEE